MMYAYNFYSLLKDRLDNRQCGCLAGLRDYCIMIALHFLYKLLKKKDRFKFGY